MGDYEELPTQVMGSGPMQAHPWPRTASRLTWRFTSGFIHAFCRTMAWAAQKSGQHQQEGSIRAAVEAYFAHGEGAPDGLSNGIELPLSEKTGFLAKDMRMLLRETGVKVTCRLDTLNYCQQTES